MKNRPPLPIPSIDDASRALEATLPAEMRQEIEQTRLQEDAEAASMAEALAPKLLNWQREILVKLVGLETLTKADAKEESARLRIKAQGLKMEHTVKTKGKKTTLTFVMKRRMIESNRVIEISRFRYTIDSKTPPPSK